MSYTSTRNFKGAIINLRVSQKLKNFAIVTLNNLLVLVVKPSSPALIFGDMGKKPCPVLFLTHDSTFQCR
jgi:hypothetical protein